MSAEPPRATTVKFRLAGGAQPLILLPVFANGAGPNEFILDTGAGTTLLSTELAQQLQVKSTGRRAGHSAAGKLQVELGCLDAIAVGEAILKDLDIAIMDLSHIGRAVNAKVDGDLGYNFLKAFCLTIDYAASEITLVRPNDFRAPIGSPLADVKMHLASARKPLALLAAHVNGRGPFQFAIDTGSSTSVVSEEIARELGLQTTPIPPVTAGSGALDLVAGQIGALSIAAARRENVAVLVGGFLSTLSELCETKLDGIVGYNFLRHFRVTFDYPNERFFLA